MTADQFTQLSDSIASGIVCVTFAIGFLGGLFG